MKRLLLLAITGLVLVLGIGCDAPPTMQTGSVEIMLQQARFVQSDLDKEIYSYEVSMTHDLSGETLGPETVYAASYAPVKFEGIETGEWTVSVDAKNEAGILVASGSSPAVVNTNRTTNVNIQLAYLEGNGTLAFSMAWDRELASPTADIQIVKLVSTDTPESIPLTISEDNTASLPGKVLANGQYMITATLSEPDVFTTAKVEAFEIMKDATTAVHFDFTVPSGGSGITITDPEDQVITLTLSGYIYKGDDVLEITDDLIMEDLPVTITADSDESITTYLWYLNGVLLEAETANSLLLGEFVLAPGDWSVTCIGISEAGIGSDTIEFSLSESDYIGGSL